MTAIIKEKMIICSCCKIKNPESAIVTYKDDRICEGCAENSDMLQGDNGRDWNNQ